MTVFSSSKELSYIDFNFEEKDGKRQYDGTSIFTLMLQKKVFIIMLKQKFGMKKIM